MTYPPNDLLLMAARYYESGQFELAQQLCQQALQIHPGHVDAVHMQGLLALASGQFELARDCLRQVVRTQPSLAEAHNNLGTVLLQMGDPNAAVAAYQEALRLKPDYVQAYCNLGIALLRQDKAREALGYLEQAVRRAPQFADALNNLGMALRQLGRSDEAIAVHERALFLRPDFAEFHNNLGLALKASERHEEALVHFRRAIELRPDYAEPHVDVALAYQMRGQVQEALATFDEALRIRPDFGKAHLAKACLLLGLGDFSSGWKEYEWRFRCEEFSGAALLEQPAWDGSPLEGRTILLRAEQGLGDTLQFVRYASVLHERGGRVIVAGQAPLLSLLQTCPGVAEVYAKEDDFPPHDVYAYLMSLPRLLGADFASIPANVPYLSADHERVARWRKELKAYQGYKVGICWQGNAEHKQDRLRSVPLAQFAPLAEVPGTVLFSIQVGEGRQQLTERRGDFAVIDLGQHFDPTSFADAAAVIKNLNLVITADTAIAHLAGALGARVWLALPAWPDWRWLLEREASPWYPTMRLFRQKELGRWGNVFDRMATEVCQLMARAAT
jgi:tetratricopeptide (TPR) repeat protein